MWKVAVWSVNALSRDITKQCELVSDAPVTDISWQHTTGLRSTLAIATHTGVRLHALHETLDQRPTTWPLLAAISLPAEYSVEITHVCFGSGSSMVLASGSTLLLRTNLLDSNTLGRKKWCNFQVSRVTRRPPQTPTQK